MMNREPVTVLELDATNQFGGLTIEGPVLPPPVYTTPPRQEPPPLTAGATCTWRFTPPPPKIIQAEDRTARRLLALLCLLLPIDIRPMAWAILQGDETAWGAALYHLEDSGADVTMWREEVS